MEGLDLLQRQYDRAEYAHSNPGRDRHTHTYPVTHSDGKQHAFAHAYIDTFTDVYSHMDAFTHANGFAYSHTFAHANSH
jgi:hypothetical protein